ncbi:IS66 family insertion sequence element accessory protein TnpB [Loktanella sp. F6476L]|uniref:IS66 family insertion sequence element accessory protein TnpB n=1 Tax=Loktanella sp. F6476L TaxID=2926405 RepID=UPI001FF272E8|nr:IS66 family insertion sequence element accessory protein TnpB [Loktanella sp. F6476L]MCK0122763.1 IS66 family insertion sequence element accessory protein TnpB [Loktanella sp. F6476L]
MIYPSGSYKVYLATHPVDFRKGMDGLAGYVINKFALDPITGAFFVFRSKSKDKIKVLVLDGTGLVLIYKRIEGSEFVWPKLTDRTMTMSKAQFEALFEGIDWRSFASANYHKPKVYSSKVEAVAV